MYYQKLFIHNKNKEGNTKLGNKTGKQIIPPWRSPQWKHYTFTVTHTEYLALIHSLFRAPYLCLCLEYTSCGCVITIQGTFTWWIPTGSSARSNFDAWETAHTKGKSTEALQSPFLSRAKFCSTGVTLRTAQGQCWRASYYHYGLLVYF